MSTRSSPFLGDPAEFEGLTQEELQYLEFLQGFVESGPRQATGGPAANIAHALADSPAGQLAWSGQLFGEALSPDEILTNVSIYWLTNTAASAARFYYANTPNSQPSRPLHPSDWQASPTTSGRSASASNATTPTSSPGASSTAAVHWAAHDARPPRQRHPPVLPQVPVDTRTVASTEGRSEPQPHSVLQ